MHFPTVKEEQEEIIDLIKAYHKWENEKDLSYNKITEKVFSKEKIIFLFLNKEKQKQLLILYEQYLNKDISFRKLYEEIINININNIEKKEIFKIAEFLHVLSHDLNIPTSIVFLKNYKEIFEEIINYKILGEDTYEIIFQSLYSFPLVLLNNVKLLKCIITDEYFSIVKKHPKNNTTIKIIAVQAINIIGIECYKKFLPNKIKFSLLDKNIKKEIMIDILKEGFYLSSFSLTDYIQNISPTIVSWNNVEEFVTILLTLFERGWKKEGIETFSHFINNTIIVSTKKMPILIAIATLYAFLTTQNSEEYLFNNIYINKKTVIVSRKEFYGYLIYVLSIHYGYYIDYILPHIKIDENELHEILSYTLSIIANTNEEQFKFYSLNKLIEMVNYYASLNNNDGGESVDIEV